jgi:hypothetical protein
LDGVVWGAASATLGGEEDGRICAHLIPESVALVHMIEPGIVASMVE